MGDARSGGRAWYDGTMSEALIEVNFDGIVGPTHSYRGLSYGNVASEKNRGAVASPKRAALEGLRKARALMELGLPQAVLPPHARPDLAALRALGFSGDDAAVLERASREASLLLGLAASASAMWTANAATVIPAADADDGRLHLVVANLLDRPHRSIEPAQTERTLRAIFADEARFAVHSAVSMGQAFGDEGAANHTRLVGDDGRAMHLFVYGRRGLGWDDDRPRRYPARQTLEASEAVARLGRLPRERAVFARQDAAVIDEGVFHNDVISVGAERTLLAHRRAFAQRNEVVEALRRGITDLELHEVGDDELTVGEAVTTYLFNSQLVHVPGTPRRRPTLIAPVEVEEHERARAVVHRWIDSGVLAGVRYFDLRQSMRNGGGPACLRLRVSMSTSDRARLGARVVLDAALADELEAWVTKHYRDEVSADDLGDPKLYDESRVALDELTRILRLGSIYPFQR